MFHWKAPWGRGINVCMYVCIQIFILGKFCLKAVVKVALSLKRLTSARQVNISNPAYDDSAEPIATEEEATSTLNK